MKKRTNLPAICRMCTRVADPAACNDIDCPTWRDWFEKRWESVRTYPRRQMDRTEPLGICIGGVRYVHPDQLREYLKNDPCGGCACPRELCKQPCRTKAVWEEAKKQ